MWQGLQQDLVGWIGGSQSNEHKFSLVESLTPSVAADHVRYQYDELAPALTTDQTLWLKWPRDRKLVADEKDVVIWLQSEASLAHLCAIFQVLLRHLPPGAID